MTSRKIRAKLLVVANDNQPERSECPEVTCGLESGLAILPGEADLLARHLSDLMMRVANDNEE